VVTEHSVAVDPSNADQLRAWDGADGAYWAAHAPRFEASLARYDGPLLDAAAIQCGERVLDVGCGTGSTTRAAARLAAPGSALGVDLSAAMVEVARRAAADLPEARFEQADAQIHDFPAAAFDVVISRTGASFFGDPLAAFTNLARATRPGGRIVLLVWQEPARNEWISEIARALIGKPPPTPPAGVPGPFALAEPAQLRRLLPAAGFSRPHLVEVGEPLWFGADPDDAAAFLLGLLGWMLEGRDEQAREQARSALHRTLEAHTTPRGVELGSAAWLVTATRPAADPRDRP
jgi:SAM-dependent methyltransferase